MKFDKKRNKNNFSNKSEKVLNRKEKRKIGRKSKKVNNALTYAKQKHTNKVCIGFNDLNDLKSHGNQSNLISNISQKILANDKNVEQNNKNQRKKKNRKSKNRSSASNKPSSDNNESSNSFKFTNNSDLRLARLQEYVNQESKKLKKEEITADNTKEKLPNRDQLIKDQNRLEQLRLGQENDNREYNRYARKLGLIAHHKKKIHPVFVDDFGGILDDIEEGTYANINKYNKDEKSDCDSEEELENDILMALSNKKILDKDNFDSKLISSDASENDSNDDETSETELEQENPHNGNLDDEDDTYDSNDQVNSPCKSERNEIELEDENSHNGNLDSEDDEYDSNEEVKPSCEFIANEAEVDYDMSDSSSNMTEDSEELLFESGTTITSKSNGSVQSSKLPSINTIFDLYDNSNDDDDDDDTDLDGFIVSDDSDDTSDYGEYSSEDEDSDKENSSEKDEEDEIVVKPKVKSKGSRIIGRKKRETPFTEYIENENSNNTMTNMARKRRRILSENSDMEAPVPNNVRSDDAKRITEEKEPELEKCLQKKSKKKKQANTDTKDTSLLKMANGLNNECVEKPKPKKKKVKQKSKTEKQINTSNSDINLDSELKSSNDHLVFQKNGTGSCDFKTENMVGSSPGKENQCEGIMKKKCKKKDKKQKNKTKTTSILETSNGLNQANDKDSVNIDEDIAIKTKKKKKKQKCKNNEALINDGDPDTTSSTGLKNDATNFGVNHSTTKKVKFSSDFEGKDTNEDYHEDIYGRLRDKAGNIIKTEAASDDIKDTKYIPPAMRKLMALNNSEKKKEQLANLQRSVKGLLNRLAESNMAGIVNQIETYYMTNSRNDMNETLTKLCFDILITPVSTPERLVQEHALMIAILSANIGSEVGAHVLTECVVRWVEELESFTPVANLGKIDSKVLDNLLIFICQLCNFKVVDASLIYDILHKILARPLASKEIDLILSVLRSIGFTLRKEDPLALKNFITEVQSKAGSVDEATDQNYTRVRFMLEILTALRNNNMAKVPNYDPSHSQHLKTLMKGLIRKGCRTSDLKVSLKDLLKSKVVGKWWIVGSAWSGGLKEEMESTSVSALERPVAPPSPASTNYSEEFRAKAAKLHMTRPPRINILYAITEGAEDYLQAFEQIINLKLKTSQDIEIFNVMIYCCIRCKEYNELYEKLALKLCAFKKGMNRLLQFAIWDKLKELSTMKPRFVANLAKFVSHLVAENCLTLGVFKVLNFLEADDKTVSFLRQALILMLLHPTGTFAVSRAFNQLCSVPKLNTLRQYLRLFIAKFINPKRCEEENKVILEQRVKLVTEILTSVGGVKL